MPRQAAGRGVRSVKGEAVTVRQVISAAKAETVERVTAKAETKTAKQAAAACQVTSAKGETTTRQDPAKARPERLGLAGLKAAAQRRRLAASTSYASPSLPPGRLYLLSMLRPAGFVVRAFIRWRNGLHLVSTINWICGVGAHAVRIH
jgi:hypothetical protein